MAFALRDRDAQDSYANYEQQSPNRDIYYRQAVNPQPNYQGGYDNNYQYSQGYAQPSQQNYAKPQYMGPYQSQASQFVNNGFSDMRGFNDPNQYNYVNDSEQYRSAMQFNQDYDRSAQAKKISRERVGKRNINKDMIKIIVAVMVVALAICGLLIANQYLSANQAKAEEEVQNLDSELLASVVTEDGSYVPASVTLIPEYEYEQSTNWFDRFCDSLGLKLK